MRSLISFLEYLLGIPMEIKDRYGGLMPFADKSLTQETMLFLAICQGFIPVGTSVFPTSISHFNIILIGQKILFLLVFVFASIRALIPSIVKTADDSAVNESVNFSITFLCKDESAAIFDLI